MNGKQHDIIFNSTLACLPITRLAALRHFFIVLFVFCAVMVSVVLALCDIIPVCCQSTVEQMDVCQDLP